MSAPNDEGVDVRVRLRSIERAAEEIQRGNVDADAVARARSDILFLTSLLSDASLDSFWRAYATHLRGLVVSRVLIGSSAESKSPDIEATALNDAISAVAQFRGLALLGDASSRRMLGEAMHRALVIAYDCDPSSSRLAELEDEVGRSMPLLSGVDSTAVATCARLSNMWSRHATTPEVHDESAGTDRRALAASAHRWVQHAQRLANDGHRELTWEGAEQLASAVANAFGAEVSLHDDPFRTSERCIEANSVSDLLSLLRGTAEERASEPEWVRVPGSLDECHTALLAHLAQLAGKAVRDESGTCQWTLEEEVRPRLHLLHEALWPRHEPAASVLERHNALSDETPYPARCFATLDAIELDYIAQIIRTAARESVGIFPDEWSDDIEIEVDEEESLAALIAAVGSCNTIWPEVETNYLAAAIALMHQHSGNYIDPALVEQEVVHLRSAMRAADEGDADPLDVALDSARRAVAQVLVGIDSTAQSDHWLAAIDRVLREDIQPLVALDTQVYASLAAHLLLYAGMIRSFESPAELYELSNSASHACSEAERSGLFDPPLQWIRSEYLFRAAQTDPGLYPALLEASAARVAGLDARSRAGVGADPGLLDALRYQGLAAAVLARGTDALSEIHGLLGDAVQRLQQLTGDSGMSVASREEARATLVEIEVTRSPANATAEAFSTDLSEMRPVAYLLALLRDQGAIDVVALRQRIDDAVARTLLMSDRGGRHGRSTDAGYLYLFAKRESAARLGLRPGQRFGILVAASTTFDTSDPAAAGLMVAAMAEADDLLASPEWGDQVSTLAEDVAEEFLQAAMREVPVAGATLVFLTQRVRAALNGGATTYAEFAHRFRLAFVAYLLAVRTADRNLAALNAYHLAELARLQGRLADSLRWWIAYDEWTQRGALADDVASPGRAGAELDRARLLQAIREQMGQ